MGDKLGGNLSTVQDVCKASKGMPSGAVLYEPAEDLTTTETTDLDVSDQGFYCLVKQSSRGSSWLTSRECCSRCKRVVNEYRRRKNEYSIYN
jgi:hypothetical protein